MPTKPAPQKVHKKPRVGKRSRRSLTEDPNDIWDLSAAEFDAKYGEPCRPGEPLPRAGRDVADSDLVAELDEIRRSDELADLNSAVAGSAPTPSPAAAAHQAVRDRLAADAARFAEDLLHDVPDGQRPVAQEVAEQAARSLLWNSSLNIKLEELLAAPSGDGVSLATLGAVAKVQRRLGEAFRQYMVVLELLRRRYADVRATVVPITRARKVGNGRR